ncbi:hypothetical protein O0L34_g5562 [Tuta absoluta]|nr:hypothetical protein O0L34_g5562 [Tuta absoluta]
MEHCATFKYKCERSRPSVSHAPPGREHVALRRIQRSRSNRILTQNQCTVFTFFSRDLQIKMSTKNKSTYACRKNVHWRKKRKRVVLGAIENVDQCDLNDQENHEVSPALVIEPEVQPDVDELLVGRRLVDVDFLYKQLQDISEHGPLGFGESKSADPNHCASVHVCVCGARSSIVVRVALKT